MIIFSYTESAPFGEYDSGSATECCGDDANEYYITTLCTGETTTNGKCCSMRQIASMRITSAYRAAAGRKARTVWQGARPGECCDVADGYTADQYCSSGYCCPNGKYFDAGSCADAEQCGIDNHVTANYYCPHRPINDPAGGQSSWWSDDPWCFRSSSQEACCYLPEKYGEHNYYDWTPITTY